jgi:DNA polymerase, archaea type
MNKKEPYLKFFGRKEDKTKFTVEIKGPKPYFYILTSEVALIDFPCSTVHGFQSLFKEDLTKVIVDNPFEMRGWKDHPGYTSRFSKTYEADVPYPTKYLIDNDIYAGVEYFPMTDKVFPIDCNVEPRTMNVDIETEYYGGSNSDMSRPIISIAFYDNYLNRIYVLAYHKDHKPGQEKYTLKSQIVKDADGKTIDIEVVKIIVSDEKDLLQLFKSFVINFDIDIFTGWNVQFDMIYILKRMEMLNLAPSEISPVGKYFYKNDAGGATDSKNPSKYKKEKTVMIRGRAIIDVLKGYRRIKWKQVEGFRLDAVAKKEFHTGKVEYVGWMGDFWKNDFNKFLEYNIHDVEMCLAIDKKYSVVDSLLGIKRIAGCELSDILYNSRILDTYILRYCKNKIVLPTKVYKPKTKEEEDNEEKVEGGFVLEPVVGLHRNVVILDLKSLYPNIMLSFNISPETVAEDGELIVGNGVRFRKKEGILKEILVDLLKKRDELRAQLKLPEVFNNKEKYTNIYKRQYLFKTFTNSAYGVTLFPGFRLYNPNMGSSITYIGRYLAHKIKDLCDAHGYTVIRQDTDSAFVDVGSHNTAEAIARGKELEAEVNKSFGTWFKDCNNDYSYFSIKFEKLYGLMFSGEEKKLYAGKIIWDWEKGTDDEGEIEIKGFASVKSDRSAFSRELQKTIFEKILNEEKTFDVIDFIQREIDKMYNKEYPFDYIAIPKAITKDLNEYNIDNPWTRGVKWSMKHLQGFEFSPKPLLLYIKRSEKYNTDVICFNNVKEVPDDIIVDYAKMLDATCYRIIEKQLIMMNKDPKIIHEYIYNKVNNQSHLSSFFRSPVTSISNDEAVSYITDHLPVIDSPALTSQKDNLLPVLSRSNVDRANSAISGPAVNNPKPFVDSSITMFLSPRISEQVTV